MILENIPGYDQMSTTQQKNFSRVFRRYMAAKGTDVQNDILINHVEKRRKYFYISTKIWGNVGYAVLDPKTMSWW